MMRAIISASLRFRYLVAALGISLVYFGATRVRELPVDVFPEFAPPRVEIQTICLGLSPAEVESLVTVPLENALAGVPGVMSCAPNRWISCRPSCSSSNRAWTSCRLPAVTGARRYRHLDAADPGAPPHMMPLLSATSRVMKIGITPRTIHHGPVDAGLLEHPQQAARRPGVANVAIWGEQLKMLMVEVDLERLAKST